MTVRHTSTARSELDVFALGLFFSASKLMLPEQCPSNMGNSMLAMANIGYDQRISTNYLLTC